ncbi:hypothetical protein [Streptomyces sp. NBC_00259]|uniref:hypothetical protein n=1 Tax=Streptomyces sp. NBC_00259 TaxID=2903643 RepID=UPI002E2DB23C|nr:hypothetical protein [Streptomyces sp. NBC_00259]
MPATLTAAHAAAPLVPVSVSVRDLSNCERAVALYASDMPTGYRQRGRDYSQLCAWIVQGAARLRLGELYRSAAYAYGYRLLCLADLTTADQQRAHALRFPDGGRFEKAERMAGLVTCFAGLGMSGAAMERGDRPGVEGNCRCYGSGWIRDRDDADDPTTEYAMNCPGHNPHALGSAYPAKWVIA